MMLREKIKAIVLDLDQNEVWQSDEYNTWNCAKFNMDTIVTSSWFEYINAIYPEGVPEWDNDYWLNKKWENEESYDLVIYHDNLLKS